MNIEGADLLLNRGIDISWTDSDGESVLHKAVRKGSLEFTFRFLDRRIDLSHARVKDEATALHLAASGDNAQLVRILLIYGAKVNVKMTDGKTPVQLAAQAGFAEVQRLLVAAGARIDGSYDNGQETSTPTRSISDP